MKHPTPEQVQKVIDNFDKVLNKFPEAIIDMDKCTIHECGTPMCHAGWYALANDEVSLGNGFRDGIVQMAQDLGFSQGGKCCGICSWAEDNPDLWGNERGGYMFCSNAAFGGKEDLTLQDIRDHWAGVKERLEATQ